jgi:capsular polysaccharide export protein
MRMMTVPGVGPITARTFKIGADLVRPLSLIIDDVGIYYDATRPSRLENILNTQDLDQEQRDRAKCLRNKIVSLGITKYNIGQEIWLRPANGKRVVLVVGQVESDASIAFGALDGKSNIGLLVKVKAQHPDAHIIYKPHPDVMAGLRDRGQGETAALDHCDEIISANVEPDDLFQKIDELHTLTSLMGFEALLRGVLVTCHGLPFYAGWGLTTDMICCDRRIKNLTIDELVHGVLVAYPRYFDDQSNCFVEPEHTLDALAEWSRLGPSTRTWYRNLLRLLIVFWRTAKGAER